MRVDDVGMAGILKSQVIKDNNQKSKYRVGKSPWLLSHRMIYKILKARGPEGQTKCLHGFLRLMCMVEENGQGNEIHMDS